jgi:hypothetical protein
MNIPCIAFLERICFHFLSFSQKAGITEGCNKTYQQKTKLLYCFQPFYGILECKNISSVTNRSDVIMQNCSVKKLETIFTVQTKITR